MRDWENHHVQAPRRFGKQICLFNHGDVGLANLPSSRRMAIRPAAGSIETGLGEEYGIGTLNRVRGKSEGSPPGSVADDWQSLYLTLAASARYVFRK